MTDDLDRPSGEPAGDLPPEAAPRSRPRRPRFAAAPPPTLIGLSDAAQRSADPATCPFFRSVDRTGAVVAPIESPDGANRCIAIDEPVPQSIRQQELMCLTRSHVTCSRYLRGAVAEHQAAVVPVRRQALSSPVLASAIILVLSATASVGFLLMRGGLALALPSPSPDGSQAAVVTSPSPTPTRSLLPSPTGTPRPSPSPTPTPSPTPEPTIERPTPAPTATATPRSDRYAVLVACPDAPDCWIYTVRAGDNFQSIVNWFGVPYDTVIAMNPGLGDPSTIHVGDRIRMPPPTR